MMQGSGIFDLSWMAWTWQTATFFVAIFLILCAMTAWEIASPGGAPRHGILGLDTTRGDRLFIALLGAAFIHLAWLGLVGPDLWWALGLSLIYAVSVFRWV
jgi:predicted small integral membrane protein